MKIFLACAFYTAGMHKYEHFSQIDANLILWYFCFWGEEEDMPHLLLYTGSSIKVDLYKKNNNNIKHYFKCITYNAQHMQLDSVENGHGTRLTCILTGKHKSLADMT